MKNNKRIYPLLNLIKKKFIWLHKNLKWKCEKQKKTHKKERKVVPINQYAAAITDNLEL